MDVRPSYYSISTSYMWVRDGSLVLREGVLMDMTDVLGVVLWVWAPSSDPISAGRDP